ncbi:MAG: hypothetical protein WC694_00970 [Candidatus Paceibacterota bacterium]|jgi:hypothetical protein
MENGKPEGEKGSILGKVFKSEGLLNAEARASSLIERARLNEAIRVIEDLEAEVRDMKISDRFSRTAKPSESVYSSLGGGMNAALLKGLTEDEYKRQVLLINLRSIRESIDSTIGGMERVILDIEATKQE